MQHLASEKRREIPLNSVWFMVVLIESDSFTLEQKGKQKLLYKLSWKWWGLSEYEKVS